MKQLAFIQENTCICKSYIKLLKKDPKTNLLKLKKKIFCFYNINYKISFITQKLFMFKKKYDFSCIPETRIYSVLNPFLLFLNVDICLELTQILSSKYIFYEITGLGFIAHVTVFITLSSFLRESYSKFRIFHFLLVHLVKFLVVCISKAWFPVTNNTYKYKFKKLYLSD